MFKTTSIKSKLKLHAYESRYNATVKGYIILLALGNDEKHSSKYPVRHAV